MKIFLDTANLDSIRKYNDMGILDGITTNPTLLSKESGNPVDIMAEIVKIVKGPVSLEVVSTNTKGMLEEAHRLKKFGSNVVVKIQMIAEGLKAINILKKNNTSVFLKTFEGCKPTSIRSNFPTNNLRAQ